MSAPPAASYRGLLWRRFTYAAIRACSSFIRWAAAKLHKKKTVKKENFINWSIERTKRIFTIVGCRGWIILNMNSLPFGGLRWGRGEQHGVVGVVHRSGGAETQTQTSTHDLRSHRINTEYHEEPERLGYIRRDFWIKSSVIPTVSAGQRSTTLIKI